MHLRFIRHFAIPVDWPKVLRHSSYLKKQLFPMPMTREARALRATHCQMC